MIEKLGHNLTSKDYVDHINGLRHDNQRKNLRIVDAKKNARNKNKKENTSSKYFGVHKKNNSNNYIVCIRCDGYYLYAAYGNELHAAWGYLTVIKKVVKGSKI